MKNWLIIFVSMLWFITGCGFERYNNADQVSLQDSINAIADGAYQSGLFTGTILVANREGLVYKNALGMADRTKNRPLKTTTPFYLASVSKQFTSAAIMLLYQDDLLLFDDPITKYLQQLPIHVYKNITVRHLLNHTSGIPDYYNFAHPTPGFTNNDVYTILQTVDSLNFKPGEQYKYSNSGYVLLSILVEKVSGDSFSQLMKDRIIVPLKMKNCTIKDEQAPEIIDPAIGYNADGSVSDYKFNTTGGGGIYASVEDLYLWDRALYTGTILHSELLKNEAWTSGVLNNGKETNYGFGWDLNPDKPWVVRHGGELEGFRTHFFRDTKKMITIIILSNSGYEDVSAMCDQIYHILSKETK